MYNVNMPIRQHLEALSEGFLAEDVAAVAQSQLRAQDQQERTAAQATDLRTSRTQSKQVDKLLDVEQQLSDLAEYLNSSSSKKWRLERVDEQQDVVDFGVDGGSSDSPDEGRYTFDGYAITRKGSEGYKEFLFVGREALDAKQGYLSHNYSPENITFSYGSRKDSVLFHYGNIGGINVEGLLLNQNNSSVINQKKEALGVKLALFASQHISDFPRGPRRK